MTIQKPDKSSGWRGSADLWIDAAYQLLLDGGVEAVKVMPLAKALGLSRTSFYWHFPDREALLEAIVARWEAKNTGNLVARCAAPAGSVCAAVFNLFDCWLDEGLFDARLDLAIRNWARNDAALQARLDRADTRRIEAVAAMFRRFGVSAAQAEVRSLTVIYTQIGYISMQIAEDRPARLARMPDYVEVFTGQVPTETEIARFLARHAEA